MNKNDIEESMQNTGMMILLYPAKRLLNISANCEDLNQSVNPATAFGLCIDASGSIHNGV